MPVTSGSAVNSLILNIWPGRVIPIGEIPKTASPLFTNGIDDEEEVETDSEKPCPSV